MLLCNANSVHLSLLFSLSPFLPLSLSLVSPCTDTKKTLRSNFVVNKNFIDLIDTAILLVTVMAKDVILNELYG